MHFTFIVLPHFTHSNLPCRFVFSIKFTFPQCQHLTLMLAGDSFVIFPFICLREISFRAPCVFRTSGISLFYYSALSNTPAPKQFQHWNAPWGWSIQPMPSQVGQS